MPILAWTYVCIYMEESECSGGDTGSREEARGEPTKFLLSRVLTLPRLPVAC
jgi:hypothetical protein